MVETQHGGDDPEQHPLLGSSNHKQPHRPPKIKTGTTWTATAHIITGVIGAGVLSLSWSIAQLGWVAGIVALLVFAGVTMLSTSLICDFYRSPHPDRGPIVNSSFMQAIRHFLGARSERICGVLVQETLYGTAVAYTITAAASIRCKT